MFTGLWENFTFYQFAKNNIIGVVVESFSYVFQLVGGAKSITREEMRAFKKVWAEFANQRTGYLEKHQLIPFFAVSDTQYPLSLILNELCATEIKWHL